MLQVDSGSQRGKLRLRWTLTLLLRARLESAGVQAMLTGISWPSQTLRTRPVENHLSVFSLGSRWRSRLQVEPSE